VSHPSSSAAWWVTEGYRLLPSSGRLSQEGLTTGLDTHCAWTSKIHRTNELRFLSDDWDGEGALAPRPEIIAVAVGLLRGLMEQNWRPPSQVAPSPTGGVIVGWRHGSDYFEAEIDGPDIVEWMSLREGEPARHWHQELVASVQATIGTPSGRAAWQETFGSETETDRLSLPGAT